MPHAALQTVQETNARLAAQVNLVSVFSTVCAAAFVARPHCCSSFCLLRWAAFFAKLHACSVTVVGTCAGTQTEVQLGVCQGRLSGTSNCFGSKSDVMLICDGQAPRFTMYQVVHSAYCVL